MVNESRRFASPRGCARGSDGRLQRARGHHRDRRWSGRRLCGAHGIRSRLLTGDRPGESVVGIVLTALSLIVMPLLARAKLRVAGSLGSRALRADAHETIVCAWLSATTLLGLGLNAVLGWWWADPLAALGMVPLITREGLEAWRVEPSPRGGP